jgi:plastocyanin
VIRHFKVVALAALLTGALAASAFAGPPARSSASSAVQATGSEFRIGLSRGKVKAGTLRVEFVNFGEDDHDLAIKRAGTSKVIALPTVHPGERGTTRFRVRRGTYLLWCTISDHKARGMHARLKVVSSR